MRLLKRRGGESASSLDLLVAGLGNPGREYAHNRHNVGWLVADELARRLGGSWRSKFSGSLAEARLGDRRVAILKPETFMNDSGRSVQAAMHFFKLTPDAVLVVHDEADLDLGRLQIRRGGGLAGQTACARSRRTSERPISSASASASAGRNAATVARWPTSCSPTLIPRPTSRHLSRELRTLPRNWSPPASTALSELLTSC